MKIYKYFIVIVAMLGIASCIDNDNVYDVDKFSLLNYDFPQGDNPWDKEIQQIAEDWGMYIIYKDVDSMALNKMWTTPIYYDPIYVANKPSSSDIQVYLGLIKEWLLSDLDKSNNSDRNSLPFYLYILNDLNDGNPQSNSYQNNHVRFKKDGLDYWCLSFTSEELSKGLTPDIIHNVACSFSYPGIKARFMRGEYKIMPGFDKYTDYDYYIGIRYYSQEEWQKDNPYAPPFIYDYMVEAYEQDEENLYLNRGIASQLGEDFEPVKEVNGRKTYGAPTWMPWIPAVIDYGDGKFERDDNPGPVPETIEERALMDFLNMIRIIMRYPEEEFRKMYPTDIDDYYRRESNYIINDKYDMIVEYMSKEYGIDLQKYADILKN